MGRSVFASFPRYLPLAGVLFVIAGIRIRAKKNCHLVNVSGNDKDSDDKILPFL